MEVRNACPADGPAIKLLYQSAYRALPRLWQWERHLVGDSPFVVAESEGSVAGALLAWADESPVGWVRLAVLENESDVDQWLALALPPVLEKLRRRGTRTLAWMDYDGWAEASLKAQGFERLTDVITLIKSDRALPEVSGANVRLRPALEADLSAIAGVDRAAFPPHWWQSETTVRSRANKWAHLDVATAEGEVIGYAGGELRLPAAHLSRIAVHPAYQGHGVGALLLRGALRSFWECGATRITLNTQADNSYSQRLYDRFGFEPTGDCVTAWELPLAVTEPDPSTRG